MTTYSKSLDDERKQIERSEGVLSGNPRVEKEEVVRSEVKGLAQTKSIFICSSVSRNTYAGTDVANGGGIQASSIGSNQKVREIKMDLCIKQYKEYSNTLKGILYQNK